MREQDWKRWLERLQELSPGQRQALMAQLHTPDEQQQVLALIDRVVESPVICPHCGGQRMVRNGQADGLQRYKCRGCGKTFNALTATPLARLRQRHKQLAQARVLDEVDRAAGGPAPAGGTQRRVSLAPPLPAPGPAGQVSAAQRHRRGRRDVHLPTR